MDIDLAISKGNLWGTKSIGFWSILSLILLQMKPKSILEIGSGRSTTFFADYAYSYSADFISIEENWEWCHKIIDDLRCMCLPTEYIKHVPIVNGWYDIKSFDNLVKTKKYDMVFIDGPSGDGRRGHDASMTSLFSASIQSDIVIIDDFHRPFSRRYAESVFQVGNHSTIIIMDYIQRYHGSRRCDKIDTVNNQIAFVVKDLHLEIINSAFISAGVSFLQHHPDS